MSSRCFRIEGDSFFTDSQQGLALVIHWPSQCDPTSTIQTVSADLFFSHTSLLVPRKLEKTWSRTRLFLSLGALFFSQGCGWEVPHSYLTVAYGPDPAYLTCVTIFILFKS